MTCLECCQTLNDLHVKSAYQIPIAVFVQYSVAILGPKTKVLKHYIKFGLKRRLFQMEFTSCKVFELNTEV